MGRQIPKRKSLRSGATATGGLFLKSYLAIMEFGCAETGMLPLTVTKSPELDNFAALAKYPEIRHFLTVTWSSPQEEKGVPFSAKPRNIPDKWPLISLARIKILCCRQNSSQNDWTLSCRIRSPFVLLRSLYEPLHKNSVSNKSMDRECLRVVVLYSALPTQSLSALLPSSFLKCLEYF